MRTALCLLLAALAAAADPPPVPDPFGLGERLALIDLLQDRYHLRPRDGAGVEELRALYRTAWAGATAVPATAMPAEPAAGEAAAASERERRLRDLILRRHGVEADRALDEPALIAELRRLDAIRATRDAEAIAAMVAADRAAPRPSPAPEAAPVPDPAAAVPPAADGAPVAAASRPGGPRVTPLVFNSPAVTGCVLVQDGPVSALLVVFGSDWNGAFRGLPQGMMAALHGAPSIRRAVLMLGHGTGNSIAGEPIEAHLKANKAFYETLGNTAPAQPVECMVFASCSTGNPNQMLAMRDGLGYFPTWRVATGSRTYVNGLVIIAALTAVAARPPAPAWRGLFRWAPAGGEVACFGEVGAGGERGDTNFFRIVQDGEAWKLEEQR